MCTGAATSDPARSDSNRTFVQSLVGKTIGINVFAGAQEKLIGKVLSAVASCEENAVKLVGRGDSSVCEAISEVFSQVRERYEEIQDGAWKCVVDIVVSQCKEGLKAVAGVPATYRMTNR